MAKTKEAASALPNKTDRSYWYTEINYIPSELKERRQFMAQSLFFAKRNSSPLVDPATAVKYRALNRSIINKQEYIEIIDPKTPMGSGGTADKFSSSFEDFPINTHLRNILQARIEKMPIGMTCSVADPMAKMQEQKDKEKIISQRYIRNIIASFLKELGLNVRPPGENEDPYKWIERFTNTDLEKVIDTVGSPIDQIKNRIKDDDGLRLFMKFVYKNGIEIAFEQAIKYYLIDQNKWAVKGEDFFNDLKNFNTYCGRIYPDLVSGMPVLEYEDPAGLFTGPFNSKDGQDMPYWFREKPITFADFEKMVGAQLTDEDKRAIFMYFKSYATNHGVDWDSNYNTPQGQALIGGSRIMIGYYAVLTQEANSFSEGFMNTTDTSQPNSMDTSWADTKQNKTIKQDNKVYNVWYNCYYIPLNASTNNNLGYTSNSPIDINWQASHIYAIKKNVDQYRYGVDDRYAKSDLVVWRDTTRLSFTAIEEHFMPMIRTNWHKYQNLTVNDASAIISDVDLILGLTNAVDEGNKDATQTNKNAVLEEMRTLKQSGQAWLKFRDKNGDKLEISPKDLFYVYDNGMLAKAGEHLMNIMQLYDTMTRALAFPDTAQGIAPKPRTPVSGIETANMASDNNSWYIEKAYKQCLIMFGERIIQWVRCVCIEKDEYHYEERWKQLVDVVGFASGATLEGIEKIPLSNIGITVSVEDTQAVKQMVNQIATQMVSQSQISPAQLELILSSDNWKLALYELTVEQEKTNELLAAQRQQEFQQQMQLKQMDLQVAQTLLGAKAQGVNQNIQMQAQVDQQLDQQMGNIKAQTQLAVGQQRNANKQQEDILQTQLDKEKESHKANLEAQSAYA